MVVDLRRIFVEDGFTLPVDGSLDMSETEVSGFFPLTKPVLFRGTFSNKASMVECKAQIVYCYEAPCDRCGAMTAREHTVSLQKTVVTSLESEESEGFLLTPDRELDLDEFIYSEVVVDLPTKHLCREDCKGICVKCGKNLNEGDCDCPKREIDPRLSALADLLKE